MITRILTLAILASGIACSSVTPDEPQEVTATLPSKPNYAKSYAVVIPEATYAKPEWRKVADALIKKHDAELIFYAESINESLPRLKEVFPKYTCFVVEPEDGGFGHVLDIHRLTRKLDDDPYGDTIWGIITGYEPKDALRMALAAEPRVVSDALLTAAMGPDRWRESYFISTHKKGIYGHKLPSGEIATNDDGDFDQTERWINYWNKMDPDAVVSSAHASQRNLEMPFSRGNIICRDGKLYGYRTKERLIDETGYAKEKTIPGQLIAINKPKKTKLYFAVGNCLIGDIPDKNCMALAWMGFGMANQMIGYTVTTWYGKAGWGTLKYWEHGGGIVPLNESFYFNNVLIINRLLNEKELLATYDFDIGRRDVKLEGLRAELGRAVKGERLTRDAYGLMYDRDTVAFYGDPALEIRLDWDHTIKALRRIELEEDNGTWTVTIRALKNHGQPNINTTPVGIFFPERLKNFKVIKGAEYKPLLTDNHLLVMAPGPFEAGEDYTIVFTAEPITDAL